MPSSLVELGGGRAEIIRFVEDAYDGVRVATGKGPAHARAVEEILRYYGHGERTQLAGLLHDVVEDTGRGLDDVRAVAGDEVAAMVAALTEDADIAHYSPRKRALRLRIAAFGGPVVDIAIADKIDSLRHALATGATVSRRKLAHYRASLDLAVAAGVADAMCGDLAVLLDIF
jgi:(p)ppGpp synthase/HD superfamily hydrolase